MRRIKYVLLLIFVLVVIGIGILITKNVNPIKQNTPNKDSNTQDSVNLNKAIMDSIPSKWKSYTNNDLGFTFQYPETWSKNGEDTKVINLSGTITEIDINFTDTISKTTLLIAYHLAPSGVELYNYASSQYLSSQGRYATGAKKMEVAGNNAIVASEIFILDGKGHKLNPPIRSIIVDLLDNKKSGTIELQFLTPVTNDDSEVTKFNQLLSTIKLSIKD